MRSPTATSSSPFASFSSSISIVASPLPPTSTKATSGPMATIVPSSVWPFSKRFGFVEASNIAAKSSSGSVIPYSMQPGVQLMHRRRAFLTQISLGVASVAAACRARDGDTTAVHLVKLEPARSYAVSAFAPGFGALVGTDRTAILAADLPETSWRYDLDADRTTARASSRDGRHTWEVPLAPFLGCLGVA